MLNHSDNDILLHGSHLAFERSLSALFRHHDISRTDSIPLERHGIRSFGLLSHLDDHVCYQIFVLSAILATDPTSVQAVDEVLLGSGRNVYHQLVVCNVRALRAVSVLWPFFRSVSLS